MSGGGPGESKGFESNGFDAASSSWIQAFNAQEPETCGGMYSEPAQHAAASSAFGACESNGDADPAFVMFGLPSESGKNTVVKGRADITGFWTKVKSGPHKTISAPHTGPAPGPVHRAQISDYEVAQHFDSFRFDDGAGSTTLAGCIHCELWTRGKADDGDWRVYRDITSAGSKVEPASAGGKIFCSVDDEAEVEGGAFDKEARQWVFVGKEHVVNIHRTTCGTWKCDVAKLDFSYAPAKMTMSADANGLSCDGVSLDFSGTLSCGGDVFTLVKSGTKAFTKFSALPTQIRWVHGFNSGDYDTCGGLYTEDGVFVAFDFPEAGSPPAMYRNEGDAEKKATKGLWQHFTSLYSNMAAEGMKVLVVNADEIAVSYSEWSWTEKATGTKRAVVGSILYEMWVQREDEGWLVHRDIVRPGSRMVCQ